MHAYETLYTKGEALLGLHRSAGKQSSLLFNNPLAIGAEELLVESWFEKNRAKGKGKRFRPSNVLKGAAPLTLLGAATWLSKKKKEQEHASKTEILRKSSSWRGDASQALNNLFSRSKGVGPAFTGKGKLLPSTTATPKKPPAINIDDRARSAWMKEMPPNKSTGGWREVYDRVNAPAPGLGGTPTVAPPTVAATTPYSPARTRTRTPPTAQAPPTTTAYLNRQFDQLAPGTRPPNQTQSLQEWAQQPQNKNLSSYEFWKRWQSHNNRTTSTPTGQRTTNADPWPASGATSQTLPTRPLGLGRQSPISTSDALFKRQVEAWYARPPGRLVQAPQRQYYNNPVRIPPSDGGLSLADRQRWVDATFGTQAQRASKMRVFADKYLNQRVRSGGVQMSTDPGDSRWWGGRRIPIGTPSSLVS